MSKMKLTSFWKRVAEDNDYTAIGEEEGKFVIAIPDSEVKGTRLYFTLTEEQYKSLSSIKYTFVLKHNVEKTCNHPEAYNVTLLY